jgi:hypothetical protein
MARAERASTADRRPSGGYGVTLPLPLGTVPPGRYLLEVEAHSDAEDGATVRRAVPISVS